MNQQVSKGHRWAKGQSGNPAGRPVGARQRISEQLLTDLASVWEEHGVSVLQRLAVTDPAKLATIAYGLLPRDIFIKVENSDPLAQLDDEALIDLQSLLATIRQAKVAGGSELFGRIEQFLRSETADVIDAKVIEVG